MAPSECDKSSLFSVGSSNPVQTHCAPWPEDLYTPDDKISQSDGEAHSETDGHFPPKRLKSKSLTWHTWLPLFWTTILLGVLPLTYLAYRFMTLDTYYNQGSGCTPLEQLNLNNLSSQSLFAIWPVTSSLTFDNVKAIDLVVNVLLGRGGQALILLISCRVFRICLVRMMETEAIPYEFYTSLAFGPPSGLSLYDMTKQMLRSKWRYKVLLTWMNLSLIWTIVSPVLVDAMTGYASVSSPYFRAGTNDYVSLDDLVNGEIVWGTWDDDPMCSLSRGLNVSKPLNVTVVAKSNRTFYFKDSLRQNSTRYSNDHLDLWVNETLHDIIYDTWLSGVGEQRGKRLRYDQITSRILKYQAFSFPPSLLPKYFNLDWFHRCVSGGDSLDEVFFSPYFCVDDDCHSAYSTRFFNEEIICGNDTSEYQWGYATYLFCTFCGLHFIWCLGTYITYIHTIRIRHSQLNSSGRRLGPYRAALDLSEAIRAELGPNTAAYSNDEIKDALIRRKGIRYTLRNVAPPDPPSKGGLERPHERHQDWEKREGEKCMREGCGLYIRGSLIDGYQNRGLWHLGVEPDWESRGVLMRRREKVWTWMKGRQWRDVVQWEEEEGKKQVRRRRQPVRRIRLTRLKDGSSSDDSSEVEIEEDLEDKMEGKVELGGGRLVA